jgi:hypothetical protein
MRQQVSYAPMPAVVTLTSPIRPGFGLHSPAGQAKHRLLYLCQSDMSHHIELEMR